MYELPAGDEREGCDTSLRLEGERNLDGVD